MPVKFNPFSSPPPYFFIGNGLPGASVLLKILSLGSFISELLPSPT